MTANSRAYEQFVRGNVLLARRTPASIQGAIAAYRAATAADSGFADGYGRLAYAYAVCLNLTCSSDADSLLRQSREAATRALRLNPRSSDAWMGRAYLLVLWSGRGQGALADDSLLAALAAFRRAVELNPRNDEAWHQYGATLGLVSDSASVDALRRALALDPARAITYVDLSGVYYVMGRTDRALATIDTAFALEPDGPFRQWRMLYRITAGDTAGAVADAQSSPGAVFSSAVLAVFAHDSAAARTLEAMAAQRTCDIAIPSGSVYLMWTGRREQAVQYLLGLGSGCEMTLLGALWGRNALRQPILAPLADDSRIQALRAASDSILARARWR